MWFDDEEDKTEGASPMIENMWVLTRLSFLQETFQEEGKKIGECVKVPVPSDVLVSKFDTILHIWI